MKEKKQRFFLYDQLYTALENSELALVWPINQNIDLNNQKMKGYCHGYSEVWTKCLLDNSTWDEPFLSSADWASLINNDRFTAWPMPLACDVKWAQTLSYSGAVYRARGEAVVCPNVNGLISEMLAQTLGMFYPTWPADQGHLFVVCLGNQPDQMGCLSWSDIMARRATPVKWHEVRLCLDPKGYVHWFDANVGWFRSQTPKPDMTCLKRDLIQIFNILQYPGQYSVVSVFEIHAKKMKKCGMIGGIYRYKLS